MRRLSILCLAAALVVSGCGGDDDDGGGSADDQAIVDAAIAALETRLEADGFVGEPDDDDDDDDAFEFESEECRAFESALPDEADIEEAAEAESDEFTRGDLRSDGVEETVSASIAVAENSDDLDLVMELFRDDRLAECFEEAFRTGAGTAEEDGITFDIDVQVTATDEDFGDEARIMHMDGTIAAEGLTVPIAFEIRIARLGDTGIFLMTGSVGDGATVEGGELMQLLVDEVATA